MTVIVYSDGSHCPRTKVAACGYVLLVDGKVIKHQVILLGDCSSGDGEFYAAIVGLQEAYLQKGVTEIHLYVDYTGVIYFRNGFRAKQKPLAKEFHETKLMIREDGIELKISHVKGHSTDKYNIKVDTSCRDHLRKYLKTK